MVKTRAADALEKTPQAQKRTPLKYSPSPAKTRRSAVQMAAAKKTPKQKTTATATVASKGKATRARRNIQREDSSDIDEAVLRHLDMDKPIFAQMESSVPATIVRASTSPDHTAATPQQSTTWSSSEAFLDKPLAVSVAEQASLKQSNGSRQRKQGERGYHYEIQLHNLRQEESALKEMLCVLQSRERELTKERELLRGLEASRAQSETEHPATEMNLDSSSPPPALHSTESDLFSELAEFFVETPFTCNNSAAMPLSAATVTQLSEQQLNPQISEQTAKMSHAPNYTNIPEAQEYAAALDSSPHYSQPEVLLESCRDAGTNSVNSYNSDSSRSSGISSLVELSPASSTSGHRTQRHQIQRQTTMAPVYAPLQTTQLVNNSDYYQTSSQIRSKHEPVHQMAASYYPAWSSQHPDALIRGLPHMPIYYAGDLPKHLLYDPTWQVTCLGKMQSSEAFPQPPNYSLNSNSQHGSHTCTNNNQMAAGYAYGNPAEISLGSYNGIDAYQSNDANYDYATMGRDMTLKAEQLGYNDAHNRLFEDIEEDDEFYAKEEEQIGNQAYGKCYATSQLKSSRPSSACSVYSEGGESVSSLTSASNKKRGRPMSGPIVCPYCNKAFKRNWLLHNHIRSHTGDKPYSCHLCPKSFADKSNLRAHVATHSDYKPYACGKCEKRFALRSYLTKHQKQSCLKEECQLYQVIDGRKLRGSTGGIQFASPSPSPLSPPPLSVPSSPAVSLQFLQSHPIITTANGY